MNRRWIVRVCLVGAGLASMIGCHRDRGDGALAVRSCDESEAPVCWPRFPPEEASQTLPRLAVFLSAGEINQNTTLARLGYPDRLLFKLHDDHPRLKVVLLGSPANRYSDERDITQSPEGAATWKALATDARFDWLEIGGQGYTHSPPGDTNLNHHEFDPAATGCNLDHARMGTPEYCRERMELAKRAYDAIGIPRHRIAIIRFPGLSDSPAALAAASEAGFLAVLDNKRSGEAGTPHWIPHPSGEILDLENTKLVELAAAAMPAGGEPDPNAAIRRLEKADTQGGVLNVRADLQDLFSEDGNVTPAYRLLADLLDGADGRYGPQVWYPRARDLALWLDLTRHARVSLRTRPNAIDLTIDPPASWGAAGSMLDGAAIAVKVPEDWKDVTEVSVGERESPPAELRRWRWFWAGPGRVIIPFDVHGPVRLRLVGG